MILSLTNVPLFHNDCASCYSMGWIAFERAKIPNNADTKEMLWISTNLNAPCSNQIAVAVDSKISLIPYEGMTWISCQVHHKRDDESCRSHWQHCLGRLLWKCPGRSEHENMAAICKTIENCNNTNDREKGSMLVTVDRWQAMNRISWDRQNMMKHAQWLHTIAKTWHSFYRQNNNFLHNFA